MVLDVVRGLENLMPEAEIQEGLEYHSVNFAFAWNPEGIMGRGSVRSNTRPS